MLGPRGRRGEVLAELHTDFAERFSERRELWAWSPGGRRELQLEDHWFHKGRVVLKFAGVDSISDAELLSGVEIQIPRERRAELETGAHYVSDLIGCEVWTEVASGLSLLGSVADVEFGAGEAPLLRIKGKGKRQPEDYIVPYAEEFLKFSDLKAKRIELRLPNGLLELQAPLDAEEKQRQKREADEARAAGIRKKHG